MIMTIESCDDVTNRMIIQIEREETKEKNTVVTSLERCFYFCDDWQKKKVGPKGDFSLKNIFYLQSTDWMSNRKQQKGKFFEKSTDARQTYLRPF